MAALTKNSGWSFISYDVIPQGGGTMGMPLELTPLYEKARKKIKNALVETTYLYRSIKKIQCCEGTAEGPLLTLRGNNPLLLTVVFTRVLQFYPLVPMLGRGNTSCKMLEAKVKQKQSRARSV